MQMLNGVKGLACNTSKLEEDYLFFAAEGEKANGNAFIQEAAQKRCIGVVSEEKKPSNWNQLWHQVPDVRQAMAECAKEYFEKPDESLRVIGITGTSGKSTVAGMIKFGLENLGVKTGLLGTIEYDLGGPKLEANLTTPESLDLFHYMQAMVNNGCKACVMEVSSHSLDRKRVYGVNFEIGVFLNISHEHLDYHISMEHYFDAKMRLFDGRNGIIPPKQIINIDGIKKKLLEVKDIHIHSEGSQFIIECAGKQILAKSQLVGAYNVSNFAIAAEVLYLMGYELEAVIEALAAFKGVEGRLDRVACGQDFSIFIDYAHKYEALKNVLEALREVTPGRLLVVFGCGGNRDRGKRKLMTQVAIQLADFVYATSDNPRNEEIEDIFSDMQEGVHGSEKIVFIPDRKAAIHQALDEAQFGDCVLIAGKGHEKYQEIKGKKFAFEDKEVVIKYLTHERISST